MEGYSNWKPNEQGRDSLANNANDWRSTHEFDLRKRVIIAIVEKLKICFPKHSQNDINNTACKFEGKIYGMATDKSDYLRKISEKIMVFDQRFKSVQSGSLVNEPNTTQDPAQALNQGPSLPTSLSYTQTPTSQQWFPQNNIHQSSGFSNQVPITVSAAQSQNIQMGEGVHSHLLSNSQRQIQGRKQFCTQPQQQLQSCNDMFQSQVNQQLLKENTHHLQPPYMQQHQHQQSLLKQPIHQHLPHHTSLSTIQQSFPQTSVHSSLTSSGQQNSQYLPRHMYVQSQEQKQQEYEQLISQLMNGQDTQQNHLTSQQNNWEQRGAFTVSPSQQNNIVSFQEMGQQSSNPHTMYLQQHLYSHSNNASSSLASQQQTYMPGGQSGNFNVYESSLLGTQGQGLGQSQPMMLQQYQQPQNRILQQHLDDTQRLHEAVSLHQTQNVANQQNQPYQLQRAPTENPYINASGGDWQEETYQKVSALFLNVLTLETMIHSSYETYYYLQIKALKEKYLPVLSTLLQKVSEKLGEVDSLPQQNTQNEPIEKLRVGKSMLELVVMFLNVHRDNISESHRDKFSLYEEQVLRFTKNRQTLTQRPMQHQQSPSGHNQHSNISLPQSCMFHEKQFHHLNQLLHSQQQQQPQTNQQQPQIQNYSSPQFVDHQILSTAFHNTGTSSQSLAPSPNLVDLEKPIYVESLVSHDYQLQTAPQEQPIDRLIEAVHSVTTTPPLDIISQTGSYKRLSSLESEADSTASSGSKAQKIEPACTLLQEIKDINGSLVETVVNICNEEVYPSEVTPGTIVTCSYSPVALSDTFEAHYKSGHISQIQPLRLLVPVNYPSSPILLLEKLSYDSSLHKYDDLSARTRSRFGLSMKEFSEPMSLKEIAQAWDVCARETMAEYAEQHGGCTFSSNYGHWDPV
ncbi:probable mediator of RNA polymerase II transcription subunit 15c isoform X2 [Brassica rapa]|uniref:probable mediator of RNA polymerase II transcription subunit 15c isoform X2 n=1 Tax=Brassica campestris TaxID=3711 RepID=UPI00142E1C04|nr:probable mediator of RNA polymerase II transcription subunit 15c isoform X2 [Brassica rapa]